MEKYSNFILVSIDAMHMWDKNRLMYSLDDLQNVSIQNNEESTDITGRGGRKIDSLKTNKTCVVTGANGLINAGLISAQTGGEYISSDSYPVAWNETIRIEDPNDIHIKYQAVGFPGAEIATVVREFNGGNIDTTNPFKQSTSTAEVDSFTYDPTTRQLVFNEDALQVGDFIRVYYTRNVAACHVDNPADKFSVQGKVILECTARDMCQNYYRSQFTFPRASLTGNFTLDVGQDQVLHNFEIEALASVTACDSSSYGQDSIYWDYVVFDRDADDAEDSLDTEITD